MLGVLILDEIIYIEDRDWHYRYVADKTHIYTGDPYDDQGGYKAMLIPGQLTLQQVRAILEILHKTKHETIALVLALLQEQLSVALNNTLSTTLELI